MATVNTTNNGLSGATGTGNFVGATSPTLVTPVLGTPTSGTLTNCTGLKFLGANGTAFRATLSSNQTVTSNVVTKVQANIEDFDVGGYYDNATNFRYTPLIAGKYLFIANTYGTTTGTDGINNVFIYKNGSEVAKSFAQYSGAATLSQTTSIIINMNGSTDYVEMYTQVSGTVVNSANTSFSGHLIEVN